ncbi:T9SS type A sorting domain-containing protein [Flavobacterium difficile]|uniref:T9SS type A sorting domain-containing protein n=1 Tax=Flavobacterium difficile TaxID=2709659 RepID=A0ABX0I362_9FLAO|nr:T9SS type A sorting domain-containing protein [Flavobacterium difficile]NHM01204.1 T9SS type A sorting domain-containing protein [Flavobacterium difficile]
MKKITFFILLLLISIGNAQSLTGTWKMSPQAGAFGVGPNQGDTSWFANSLADVTTRACFFDDLYVFNADGSFSNVLGAQSWIEGWQGGSDACGTPVAPHNGTNAATWSQNTTNNTLTLTGVGAYLGLAKAYNGGELSTPTAAPASITYKITSLTTSLMTLDIQINGGWWRYILAKQGVAPTCTDGIQNGTETGVDCGGSCSACLAQINLPINFEGTTTNYTVTDFGGTASTLLADPTNPSNTVIRTIKTTGAALWAGTTMSTPSGFSSAIPFTASNRKVYVRVWSPDAGIPVRLKVEVVGTPTQSCETQTNTTVVGWQMMEFDFNNQASGTAVFNPAFNFNLMSIFFNFGTDGATAGEKTYYFDSVSYAAPLSNQSFEEAKISMYPNPATSTLFISSLENIEAISIYNVIGQEVMNLKVNDSNAVLDVSSFQKGLYIVKTISAGKISSSKFIKE